jgi:hypothetical protein
MAEFAPQPPAIDTTTPQKLDESPIPSATARKFIIIKPYGI